MKKVARKIFLLSMVLLLAAACNPSPSARKPETAPTKTMTSAYDKKIKAGDKELSVEIMKTPLEMEKGLSDRDKLADDKGMLFDFGQGANVMPGFWMKDMKFDLDFIWIKDGKIIDVTKNVPAPKNSTDDIPMHYPPSPVDQVLEVIAGWSDKFNIKKGDEVRLQ